MGWRNTRSKRKMWGKLGLRPVLKSCIYLRLWLLWGHFNVKVDNTSDITKKRVNPKIVFRVHIKWERVRNKVRNNPGIASHVWKWQGGSVRCVDQGIYANTGNAQACRECRIYLRSIFLSAISFLDKLKFSARIEAIKMPTGFQFQSDGHCSPCMTHDILAERPEGPDWAKDQWVRRKNS